MKYAGFWIRFLAHLIDFALWNAAEFALEWGLTLMLGLGGLGEQVLGVMLSFAIVYVYYVEIPVRTGTTIGKRIFGIRVLDRKTGLSFTRKQAILRTVSYLASYGVVGAGFLMVLFHPQKLGLHDLFAGTGSVRDRKPG